jgi:hypothetical protein
MLKNFNNVLAGLFLAGTLFVAGCAKDPCATVTCKNSGTCANGSCNCPEGWSGSDCGTQKTPSKVRISKIEILNFPTTEAGGGGWDLTSGADLYPVITNAAGTSVVWSPTTYVIDAVAGSTYSWTPVPAVDLDATTQYIIAAFDDDSPANPDYIKGMSITPFETGKGFPTEWTWTSTDGLFKVKFTVSYVF